MKLACKATIVGFNIPAIKSLFYIYLYNIFITYNLIKTKSTLKWATLLKSVQKFYEFESKVTISKLYLPVFFCNCNNYSTIIEILIPIYSVSLKTWSSPKYILHFNVNEQHLWNLFSSVYHSVVKVSSNQFHRLFCGI